MTASGRSVWLAMGILLAADVACPGQMAMSGAGRSLGGYGAATISSYYVSGAGGYVPYAGGGRGFVPVAGGPGGGLGVQPVPRRLPTTAIGGTMMGATPIGGASLGGGRGMSQPGGRRAYLPWGDEAGAGMLDGPLMRPMSRPGAASRARSGPGFGYPFRMPPSLPGSSTMAMP